MQSSLPHNSIVDHNHGPLKRQKKSHSMYSLPVDPHSPVMPLQAIMGNKTYRVGLKYSSSCFFCSPSTMFLYLIRSLLSGMQAFFWFGHNNRRRLKY